MITGHHADLGNVIWENCCPRCSIGIRYDLLLNHIVGDICEPRALGIIQNPGSWVPAGNRAVVGQQGNYWEHIGVNGDKSAGTARHESQQDTI